MTPQAYREEAERQIRERLDAAVDCWNERDLDGYMKIYQVSESTALITDLDIIWGVRGIRKFYKKIIGTTGRLKFHIVSVDYLADQWSIEYAYVIGQFTIMKGNNLPEGRGNFSLLMTRQNGVPWSVLRDHSA